MVGRSSTLRAVNKLAKKYKKEHPEWKWGKCLEKAWADR